MDSGFDAARRPGMTIAHQRSQNLITALFIDKIRSFAIAA
jgi:hypothetical protein